MTLDYTFERRLELTKRDATASGMANGLKQGLEKGLKQGLEQGLEQGRASGKVQKLIQLTYKKYQKGLTVEETAEMLEEDTETIRKIYDAIKKVGTDDTEEIYEKYLRG